ncbi:hypothetical protein GGD55_005112 [Rhizobium giardinii]|jgi:hypothetical protein|uniref:Uncharacterized protein n=1 Tax=Rhizobium giardinii TaxID=56731 RepID=A0A7W8XB53_9HYPH|nr:hypothetical protein [Rhizobium giardinii]
MLLPMLFGFLVLLASFWDMNRLMNYPARVQVSW